MCPLNVSSQQGSDILFNLTVTVHYLQEEADEEVMIRYQYPATEKLEIVIGENNPNRQTDLEVLRMDILTTRCQPRS